MAVIQLASSVDVVASIGRALTSEESAKIGAILDKASELFRGRSGQQFTPGESTTRIKVNGGEVRLKQRPVTEVVSVASDSGDPIPFTLFGSKLTVPMPSSEFVVVTYRHGGDVPDLVRLCIADIAKMVLGINRKAAEGVTQYSEATGPYNKSEQYATWAVGGATRLTPDDLALADTFKVNHGSVIVQSA